MEGASARNNQYIFIVHIGMQYTFLKFCFVTHAACNLINITLLGTLQELKHIVLITNSLQFLQKTYLFIAALATEHITTLSAVMFPSELIEFIFTPLTN